MEAEVHAGRSQRPRMRLVSAILPQSRRCHENNHIKRVGASAERRARLLPFAGGHLTLIFTDEVQWPLAMANLDRIEVKISRCENKSSTIQASSISRARLRPGYGWRRLFPRRSQRKYAERGRKLSEVFGPMASCPSCAPLRSTPTRGGNGKRKGGSLAAASRS
jgi:hypothetical protein